LSDAAHLRWDAIDLAEGTIRTVQGKTKKDVLVPIHPRLREAREAAAGDVDGPVCPTLYGRETRGTEGLSIGFSDIMRRAGIAVEKRGTGKRKLANKSFHSLRHTFIRNLLSAGVIERVRMQLAGHASESAHRRYDKPAMDLLREAINRLP
jgi:integrase